MKSCKPEDWDRHTMSLNWDKVRVHGELVAAIRGTSARKVLEVGAETGVDATHLANEGCDVTVVDYSGEAIKILKERKGIKVVKADGLHLPFRDCEFDAVYSQGLLEHFRHEDARRLLQEQKRVVRKGGYVVVDVPNTLSPYTLPKQLLIAADRWIVPWETQYTAKQLRMAGEREGMIFTAGYAWGYDKFIGKRLAPLMRNMLDGTFDAFETRHGHLFMNCIGAVFRKAG